MLIAWTTVSRPTAAEQLASGAIEQGLAVCVQVEGPITSHYRWEGKLQREAEYRLCFKLMPDQRRALEAWVMARHPYETPEWIVIEASGVGEKYLSWAMANSTS
ncbi:MAG: divalent-cation tolerance protein CutA [Verrucomicrobiota bacterium]